MGFVNSVGYFKYMDYPVPKQYYILREKNVDIYHDKMIIFKLKKWLYLKNWL